MGLFAAVLQRLPGQRIKELTNALNPGGLTDTALAGTVTVTAGSTTVTGSGTGFVTSGLQALVNSFGAIVIQFSSQPGVNYVVTAVASDTSLTLSKPYGSVTTAGATATLPAIGYNVLQDAVFDAEQHFVTVTNFPFDDLTQNAQNAGAVTALNKCIWAGVSLVVAYLYDPGRGHPWPEAEVDAAWRTANRRLEYVRANYGDGAFAAPVSDSQFNPSTGPTRLPDMDNARWGQLSSNAPGPGPGDVPGDSVGSGNVDTSWGF